MDVVHPVTALYWGPVALRCYPRRGRRMTPRWAEEHGTSLDAMMEGGAADPPRFGPFARVNAWPPPPAVDTPGYWMLMQAGMIIGFFSAWPVNARLIRRGLKEKM